MQNLIPSETETFTNDWMWVGGWWLVGYGGIKNQKIDLVNMESGGSTGSNTADRKKTIRLITD